MTKWCDKYFSKDKGTIGFYVVHKSVLYTHHLNKTWASVDSHFYTSCYKTTMFLYTSFITKFGINNWITRFFKESQTLERLPPISVSFHVVSNLTFLSKLFVCYHLSIIFTQHQMLVVDFPSYHAPQMLESGVGFELQNLFSMCFISQFFKIK